MEVQSLSCVYVQTEAGVDNPLNLLMNSNQPTAQRVELHSSNSDLVRIGNPKNQYNLLPRPSDLPSDQTQVNYLNVIAKSFSPEEKKVVVNAIGK